MTHADAARSIALMPGERCPMPCDECDRDEARERLEYLRSQIRAESISYGEISELQDLTDYIEPGDVELLQWAGVPEFGPEREAQAEAYRRTME